MDTSLNAPLIKNQVVETFLVPEVTELIYDNEKLERWHTNVKELGLEGQTQVVTPTKSPIPFMPLKKAQVSMFETLCPTKEDVKKYSASTIPLEILDLIGLSIKEDYFSRIEIWYDEKTPDPVCIGVVECWQIDKPGGQRLDPTIKYRTKDDCQKAIEEAGLIGHTPYHYLSIDDRFLIGRWGDVAMSFEELKKLATERYITEQSAYAAKMIQSYQDDLRDVEKKAFDRFN